TNPYPPRQSPDIEALGHHIDQDQPAGQLRLTMGGAPTRVSIDGRAGAGREGGGVLLFVGFAVPASA
ncbi:hypothetical protein GAY30_31270, partial [Azospirillum brasilense]|nr:hypothetical protein [Azospirillum brasilense]